jgi:hypothetical protein
VHAAVQAIAQACVIQPDQMLHDLLDSAIGECAAWCGRQSGPGIRRDTTAMAAAH